MLHIGVDMCTVHLIYGACLLDEQNTERSWGCAAPAETALPDCLFAVHGVQVDFPQQHFPLIGAGSKLLTCGPKQLTEIVHNTQPQRQVTSTGWVSEVRLRM